MEGVINFNLETGREYLVNDDGKFTLEQFDRPSDEIRALRRDLMTRGVPEMLRIDYDFYYLKNLDFYELKDKLASISNIVPLFGGWEVVP